MPRFVVGKEANKEYERSRAIKGAYCRPDARSARKGMRNPGH